MFFDGLIMIEIANVNGIFSSKQETDLQPADRGKKKKKPSMDR